MLLGAVLNTFAPGLVAGTQVVGGDPTATRTVYAIVIALGVIGLVLVAIGIWVIRATRVDPDLLGPLEVMADRAWRKRDPTGRRRLLDEARPDGAAPVRPSPIAPDVEQDFDEVARRVPSFHDLEGDRVGHDPDDPVAPAGSVAPAAAPTLEDIDAVIGFDPETVSADATDAPDSPDSPDERDDAATVADAAEDGEPGDDVHGGEAFDAEDDAPDGGELDAEPSNDVDVDDDLDDAVVDDAPETGADGADVARVADAGPDADADTETADAAVAGERRDRAER